MGIYDIEIKDLKIDILHAQDRIDQIKKKIAELNDINDNIDEVNRKTISIMDRILNDLNVSSNDNFLSYFKGKIDVVAQKNGVYKIDETDTEYKSRICEEILRLEDEIRHLKNTISTYESDLSYYQNNNIEKDTRSESL